MRPTRLTESPSGSMPSSGTVMFVAEPDRVRASRLRGDGAELWSASCARTSTVRTPEAVCP